MLLAKTNPEISLEEHLFYVAFYINEFAKEYNIHDKTAEIGAVLHDIGKAHPEFQHRIRMPKIYPRAFRHELSSLAFLSLFENKDALIEMVVAHHKSIEDDYAHRGILDLEDYDRHWIEYHLGDWDSWSPRALDIFANLGLPVKQIPLEEARNNLIYAAQYCESLKYGWSKWRGLLNSADYMASAFHDKFDEIEKNLFHKPNMDFYHQRGEKANEIQFPLAKKQIVSDKKHTLVVSPTGSGKTDFLMRRAKSRVYYCLPFQASINAMTNRFRKELNLNDKQVRMQHASSRISDAAASQIGIDLQNFGGASIKVLTPFQIAGILFCHQGFESLLLDIQNQDVVLDEVHTYSQNAQAIVLEIVELLVSIGCRVHIGTATMPTVLYQKLLNIMGGPDNVHEVSLTEKELEFYNRHVIVPEYEDFLTKAIRYCIEEKEKVLMVANTVADAQNWYARIKEAYPEIKTMLLHSRYRRKDRAELEKKLLEEYDAKNEPCIVVSTQVVEVSIDISFDRMFTVAAPIDALVQRFGRVNRRIKPNETRPLKYIHILKPEGAARPYQAAPVKKSFDILANIGALEEKNIQSYIDEVYPSIEVSTIKSHVLWRNGKLMMKKLCNIKKSPLIELLEIDSITCILEKNIDEYIAGNFISRNELEISLHNSALFHLGEMKRLNVGNNPYILEQQALYDMFGVIVNKDKVLAN